MIKSFRNFSFLIAPFLLMAIVNEYSRQIATDKPYQRRGLTFINSDIRTPDKCSWTCHNYSNYCDNNHITFMGPIKSSLDIFYFGIIRALKSVGNYAIANLIFLVIGWPLLMWYLLISCLNMRDRLKSHSL